MASGQLSSVLDRAQALGFIGARPVGEHISQALAMSRLAVSLQPDLLVDLGSGGGVPGLVLAEELQECVILLVESMERRAVFLESHLRALGVDGHTSVVNSPAEDAAHSSSWRGKAGVVTARGFGPPSMTAEIAAGFLSPGGSLIATVSREKAATAWPLPSLRQLGYSDLRLHLGSWPMIECVMGPRTAESAPFPRHEFPRRRSLSRRRPLFGADGRSLPPSMPV